MKFSEFKREIKSEVGRKYKLTARYLSNGKVKFEIPARELVAANTVGLAFSADGSSKSYIKYPKAKNFEGSINSFSFVCEGFGVRMSYQAA